jgi:hypothetical protein
MRQRFTTRADFLASFYGVTTWLSSHLIQHHPRIDLTAQTTNRYFYPGCGNCRGRELSASGLACVQSSFVQTLSHPCGGMLVVDLPWVLSTPPWVFCYPGLLCLEWTGTRRRHGSAPQSCFISCALFHVFSPRTAPDSWPEAWMDVSRETSMGQPGDCRPHADPSPKRPPTVGSRI